MKSERIDAAKAGSFGLFSLMFVLVSLINVNFSILRSMRNALVVADLSGTAAYIPYFELAATVPGAIAITWLVSGLMKRMSIRSVFLIVLAGFLAFFLVFAFAVYPFLGELVFLGRAAALMSAALFYAAAELWKVALLSVLFWGLLNEYLKPEDAKKYYAPLMLGSSVGAVFSGPLISLCTSSAFTSLSADAGWSASLSQLTLLLTGIGVVTGWLYHLLFTRLKVRQPELVASDISSGQPESLALKTCLSTCRRSPYLSLLAFIVVADYLAYSIGEVVFLDVLKLKFPDPTHYCQYMGMLSSCSGALTGLCALFIAPWLLRKGKWVIAAMATPICLIIFQGAFLGAVSGGNFRWELGGYVWTGVEVSVFLGSLQFCLLRATKYALLDASKELVFVYLPGLARMQGKLVIDGIGARFGRGGASLCSVLFTAVCGGVARSAWLCGVAVCGVGFVWIAVTRRLGSLVGKKMQEEQRLGFSSMGG